MNSLKFVFGVGAAAFLGALALVGAQTGWAQRGDGEVPPPLLRPAPLDEQRIHPSWAVPVANACLVDSVTVERGVSTSDMAKFESPRRVTQEQAERSEKGRATCDNLTRKARNELPKKLWGLGDELCMEEEKAPKGGTACKAVRGNLHPKAMTCACEFEGLNPIQGRSTEWKVTATCVSRRAVDYVCDP